MLYKQTSTFSLLLIIGAILSFVLGFKFNEIPMGSGGYEGDINFVIKSLEIFNNNNLVDSINLFRFSSNRPPLMYIIHKYLNPSISNIEFYRTTVFLISFISPFFLFYALREKFKETNILNLLLFSSVIYLNPIFRNSSFWGLEENYAFIVFFLSLLFFEKIKNSLVQPKNSNIISLAFFSSLTIYFDQKFLIIPLFYFVHLMFSNLQKEKKFLLFLTYCVLATPYLFFIYLWKDIFPSDIYKIGKIFYLDHIIYAVPILSFYIIPLLFFENNLSKNKIKNIYLNYKFLFFLIILLLFIYYINFFYNDDFINNLNDGGGILKKISHILFHSIILKKIFVYLVFFISCFILFYYSEIKVLNIFIILYFLLISVFAKPYYQEYFDPFMIFVYIFLFGKKLSLKFKNILLFYCFMSVYLIGSIYYYNF